MGSLSLLLFQTQNARINLGPSFRRWLMIYISSFTVQWHLLFWECLLFLCLFKLKILKMHRNVCLAKISFRATFSMFLDIWHKTFSRGIKPAIISETHPKVQSLTFDRSGGRMVYLFRFSTDTLCNVSQAIPVVLRAYVASFRCIIYEASEWTENFFICFRLSCKGRCHF